MKIAYYSSIYFTDCDFPLIKQYQKKGIDTLYLIELVNNHFSGGLFNIQSKLPKHGFVCAKHIPEFCVYKDYINLNNVFLVIRTSKLFDPINWMTYLKLCFKLYAYNATILHITQVLGISEFILYLFRKKMVLTVHDPFLHSGEVSKTAEKKRRLAFKIIPKLVLLNKKQIPPFISFYKPKGKVFTNTLGVYDCLNCLYDSTNNKRGRRYVLFFGHFSPYKGIDVLCQAMQSVSLTIKDVYCIIAGKGKLDFDFSIYEKGENIKIINKYIETKELVKLIEGAEFTVCPYKDATQSGVVSSSFAMNKPVIASDVGGLSESVIDNVTGKLVVPNNPQALADAIIYLLNNPEEIKRYSNNIAERNTKGEFSWDNISEKYLEIYRA